MLKNSFLCYTSNGENMKRKTKKKIKSFFIILVLVAVIVLCFLYKDKFNKYVVETNYVASSELSVSLYDNDYNSISTIVRGTKVSKYDKVYVKEDRQYVKIEYNNDFYMIDVNNLVDKIEDIVKEENLYIRTNATVYKDGDSSKIMSFIKKGQKVKSTAILYNINYLYK